MGGEVDTGMHCTTPQRTHNVRIIVIQQGAAA